jgi:hypothetical protein
LLRVIGTRRAIGGALVAIHAELLARLGMRSTLRPRSTSEDLADAARARGSRRQSRRLLVTAVGFSEAGVCQGRDWPDQRILLHVGASSGSRRRQRSACRSCRGVLAGSPGHGWGGVVPWEGSVRSGSGAAAFQGSALHDGLVRDVGRMRIHPPWGLHRRGGPAMSRVKAAGHRIGPISPSSSVQRSAAKSSRCDTLVTGLARGSLLPCSAHTGSAATPAVRAESHHPG